MEFGSVDDSWRTLVGVGLGYVLATGLILIGFFLLPYLVLSAL
ncbi:hypothetical protein [Halorubrum tibetense]|uniref:Uncharacterized protein n=1 Tax=Halorubrum tibetense TaxID=175631 RepID=A0ABD5SF68_9EURY